MEGRPGFLKFIMGPDYINAGQVRSEVVHLRNQISKLTRVANKLPEADQIGIEESIALLKTELNTIETRLYRSLKGISLFGWLNKLLTGFVDVPETSPIPSPTIESIPSGSPLGSPTPEGTISPTTAPSPTV